MVNFKDLDISQLHKIVKIYNLEVKIIPKGKQISKLSRDELATEIDKHLELKDGKIFYRQKQISFDIPKKSPPRKEPDPDAPIRPKKPSKSDIIEQLKIRINELEKMIEDLKGKKPEEIIKEYQKEKNKKRTPEKIKQYNTKQYIKRKMKNQPEIEPPKEEKVQKFEPNIGFEVIRKNIYRIAKKSNLSSFIDLLKNKKMMKELKRIYESGDMIALLKLTTDLIKKETNPEKRLELLKRHALFNAILSVYEKLSKNPDEIVVEF
jgi:hypothetical protein